MTKTTDDYGSLNRATKLAADINAFWLARGYDVRAKPVREPWVRGTASGGYGVSSLLKNGLPPKRTKVKK
jgi:hypothetical protein